MRASLLQLGTTSAVVLAFFVGCGQGSGSHTGRISRNLSPVNHSKNKSNPKVAGQISSIDAAAAKLDSDGQAIGITDLTQGVYTLTGLSSYFMHQDSKTGEDLRVFHNNNVAPGPTFTEVNPQQAGTVAKTITSSRIVNLPTSFSIKTLPWVISAEEQDKGTPVEDKLVFNNKSYSLQDSAVQADNSPSPISILHILATQTANGTVYNSTTDNSVPVELKITRLADKSIRFIVTVKEKQPSDKNTTANTSDNVTETRNIYVDYAFVASATASTADVAPNPAAPADQQAADPNAAAAAVTATVDTAGAAPATTSPQQ